jgi:hypothetical protein
LNSNLEYETLNRKENRKIKIERKRKKEMRNEGKKNIHYGKENNIDANIRCYIFMWDEFYIWGFETWI